MKINFINFSKNSKNKKRIKKNQIKNIKGKICTMMKPEIHYKYTRLLESFPTENNSLYIAVANVKEVKTFKDTQGEIINQKIQTGPSYSLESDNPFINLESISYELSPLEFDYLHGLYQTDKKEFVKYKRDKEVSL